HRAGLFHVSGVSAVRSTLPEGRSAWRESAVFRRFSGFPEGWVLPGCIGWQLDCERSATGGLFYAYVHFSDALPTRCRCSALRSPLPAPSAPLTKAARMAAGRRRTALPKGMAEAVDGQF